MTANTIVRVRRVPNIRGGYEFDVTVRKIDGTDSIVRVQASALTSYPRFKTAILASGGLLFNREEFGDKELFTSTIATAMEG